MFTLTIRKLIFFLCAVLIVLGLFPFAHVSESWLNTSQAYSAWRTSVLHSVMPLSALAVASLIWAERTLSAWLAMAVNTVVFILAIKNICDTADRFSRVCGIDISVSYGAMAYGLCLAVLWVLLLSYHRKNPGDQQPAGSLI
ncbi:MULTISPECIES: DUF202 domain-containing protein [Alcaligenes]|uniref:DUF202 domain-containing protein n=1 Tax=Alcaligenes ammonioxydans TaxID=2582914 RepID=A0ABX8SRY2_9BURK|nr:DUF202 domain-containing protein [Alcaligenes ammonioxydans]EJC63162.1 hypothetical protein QWA_06125 [Alcaligenes faecalis subsp. faecalis NCIB 8687]QBH20760.1 DUF202 domain-containing protein [Alcaligenes faecalis]QXX78787.1 DUF202 domain-containing protein [Alcaligenes ammonioxydans]HRK84259.1 DUF202 domain-containing protein [Alcaligenes faecalis]